MSKSITEQIADLQDENERLKELDKLFERAIRNEFGCGRKSIKKMIKDSSYSQSNFEQKICAYFELKTVEEMNIFLAVICSDSTRNYFNNKRACNSQNEDR